MEWTHKRSLERERKMLSARVNVPDKMRKPVKVKRSLLSGLSIKATTLMTTPSNIRNMNKVKIIALRFGFIFTAFKLVSDSPESLDITRLQRLGFYLGS